MARQLFFPVKPAWALALVSAWVLVNGAEPVCAHEVLTPDGRIEDVTVPADLPDPERWRFSPRERLSRGNFFERLFLTSFVLPVISFESDVGAGGGLALVDLDLRHQGRIERLGVLAEYTTEGQQTYLLSYERLLHYRRVPQGVFREERNRLYLQAGFKKPLTLRYFGRGGAAPPAAESSYSDEQVQFQSGVVLTVPGPTGDWLVDLGLMYERHQLGAGFVEPSTDVAHAQEFADSPPAAAVRLVSEISYDTRDSFANPYEGVLFAARAELQPESKDGLRTDRFQVTGSFAFTVPPLLHDGGTVTEWNPPTDVVAGGVNLQWIAGDDPIYNQPTLGGPFALRGYITGRWHDRAALSASLEYRPVLQARGFPLPWLGGLRVERVGLVLFADAGAVAEDVSALADAKWKFIPGVGLRFMLERDAPLRIDIGFSDEGYELSIQFGQAF